MHGLFFGQTEKVPHHQKPLNMSSLTDSYIVFTLKMESVSKNTIFGLKMMVKSGLEKIILKSLMRQVISITEFMILDTYMK